MDSLRPHDVTLREGALLLRPLTEDDWTVLHPLEDDPEVLWFSEGADVSSRPLEELQLIYRQVSERAYPFLFVLDDEPIGGGWLQEMNLPEILARHPGKDLRRIDLTIGKKDLWGFGIGTKIIGLLTAYAFDRDGADAVYGITYDTNPRCRRALEKNGFVLEHVVPQAPDRKQNEELQYVLTRARHETLVAGWEE